MSNKWTYLAIEETREYKYGKASSYQLDDKCTFGELENACSN